MSQIASFYLVKDGQKKKFPTGIVREMCIWRFGIIVRENWI